MVPEISGVGVNMRIFLTLALLFPTFAFATDETLTLLDCNTADGPDQQVTVKETDGDYTLIELTTSGMQVQRSLSKEEWDSRRLKLRDSNFGDSAELYQVTDGWFLTVEGLIKFSGYADCWDAADHGG